MYDVELPDERTYNRSPVLTREALEANFAEAMVIFDWACPDLAASNSICFVIVKGALRVSMPNNQRRAHGGPFHNAVWHATVRVWSRGSYGVSSYPRQNSQRY